MERNMQIMGLFALAVVVCATATTAREAHRSRTSHRALRDVGGRRHLQATQASPSKTFEQMYFAETMAEDISVTLLESGPFKLEASCKTIVIQNTYSSWYSSSTYPSRYSPSDSSSYDYTTDTSISPYTTYSNSSGSYSYDDYFTNDWTWDPEGNYTESFLALDLTYTAPEADYLFGSPSWWYHHPNETLLVGAWEAGESRTSTVFRGYDGSWGDDFTIQSTSGHYISVDGGDTIGIHRAHTEWLPGGNSSFPEGAECMVAGFFAYHIPA